MFRHVKTIVLLAAVEKRAKEVRPPSSSNDITTSITTISTTSTTIANNPNNPDYSINNCCYILLMRRASAERDSFSSWFSKVKKKSSHRIAYESRMGAPASVELRKQLS